MAGSVSWIKRPMIPITISNTIKVKRVSVVASYLAALGRTLGIARYCDGICPATVRVTMLKIDVICRIVTEMQSARRRRKCPWILAITIKA